MTVLAFMVILKDIFPTIRAAGNFTRNIYTTRRASFGTVANLMTAFWTLDNHIFVIIYFSSLMFEPYVA